MATVYRDHLEDVERLVDFIFLSPHAHFLLATTRWDASLFEGVTGSLTDGFSSLAFSGPVRPPVNEVTLDQVEKMLRTRAWRPSAAWARP